MSRFQLGDRVCITGPIATKYLNREGVVINAKINRHSRTGRTSLDKYTVRFDDGDQREFFDIQLARAVLKEPATSPDW